MNKTKSFEIPIEAFRKAYCKVKENKGCSGVDNVSFEMFDENLDGNLYKIWNRMSSGCYFPLPVRMVEIPKDKGVRKLGIPTIVDRVAQMVTKMYLEPIVNPTFHENSYGYRPNMSAHDAVGKARKNCWKYNWVIDLDIKGFFDNIDHKLMMAIVKKHTKEKWVLLYVERWLKAPAQVGEEIIHRNKGTPQGGVISPLLANMFLDFVFDKWMKEIHPYIPFERYADDIVVHCHETDKPKSLLHMIEKRFREYKLEINLEKTKLAYCKDCDRKGRYKNTQFDFLGFTFRPRMAKNKYGILFLNFLPAISKKATKYLRTKIRGWKIKCLCHHSIQEIALMVNSTVRGWINYYGRFYKSALVPILRQLELTLIKWVMRKYKNYRRHFLRATRFLGRIVKEHPNMFVHWECGVKSKG